MEERNLLHFLTKENYIQIQIIKKFHYFFEEKIVKLFLIHQNVHFFIKKQGFSEEKVVKIFENLRNVHVYPKNS